MKIECYIFEGCGSAAAAMDLINEALKLEEVKAEVYLRILSREESQTMGITGSPTIFINGRDIMPEATQPGFS